MKPIVEIKVETKRLRPKTVILMWNPSISDYKMEGFESDLEMLAESSGCSGFTWEVWDHENVKYGDDFYLIKVGPGVNGVVMHGSVESSPCEGEDWSGRGRKVFYSDLDIDEMIHPDKCPLLTSDELAAEIPDFDWYGGHSGRVLTKDQAKKLKTLWKKYLKENEEIFKPRAFKF